VGTPQFSGATSFMQRLKLISKKHGPMLVTFDDCDLELVSKYTWMLHGEKLGNVYASATHHELNGSKRQIKMHRLIMGEPDSVIDHRDNNSLNNCRSNLRLCTDQQNNMNRRKSVKQNTLSIYKGVTYDKHLGLFRAYIRINKTHQHIGHFKRECMAALAYNDMAIKHLGEIARLNVIDQHLIDSLNTKLGLFKDKVMRLYQSHTVYEQ